MRTEITLSIPLPRGLGTVPDDIRCWIDRQSIAEFYFLGRCPGATFDGCEFTHPLYSMFWTLVLKGHRETVKEG